jgi:hypothetical protein
MSGPYDDKFREVMARKVGETDLTHLEVYLIGHSLLNWINMTAMLGHTRPGNSLDYVGPSGNPWTDLVYDFVAWTSGRDSHAPLAADSLVAYMHDSGWAREAMQGMSDELNLGDSETAATSPPPAA